MTTQTIKPTRYTAKCKGCAIHTSGLDLDGMRGAKLFGTKIPGAPVVRPEVFEDAMGNHVIACRGCGANRLARMVVGRFSAKHVCSAKCLASTDFVCDCSCGGKNHGAGHVAEMAVAS